MNTIDTIARGIVNEELTVKDILGNDFDTRGEALEYFLTEICDMLFDSNKLLEGNGDIEFLLNIVASYIISKEKGTLKKDTVPPSVLFDKNVFPAIDAAKEKEADKDGNK